tara:strand:- start:396 stop:704 length:309 start_codon:yes stop_codon:yes gene_type:complete
MTLISPPALRNFFISLSVTAEGLTDIPDSISLPEWLRESVKADIGSPVELAHELYCNRICAVFDLIHIVYRILGYDASVIPDPCNPLFLKRNVHKGFCIYSI